MNPWTIIGWVKAGVMILALLLVASAALSLLLREGIIRFARYMDGVMLSSCIKRAAARGWTRTPDTGSREPTVWTNRFEEIVVIQVRDSAWRGETSWEAPLVKVGRNRFHNEVSALAAALDAP